MHKVKAHQDLGGAENGWDAYLRAGNHAVDVSAKAAAALHPVPNPEQADELDRSLAVAKAVGLLAAKVMPFWPRLVMGPNVQRVPVVFPSAAKADRPGHVLDGAFLAMFVVFPRYQVG